MKLRIIAAASAVVSLLAAGSAIAEGTVTANLSAANAVFTCAAQRCVAATTTDETYSLSGCKALAKKVGKLTSFSNPKHELSADDLAKCNAGV